MTIPWNEVDRKVGMAIAVIGMVMVTFNLPAFVNEVQIFATWWIALSAVVPSLQLGSAVFWRQLPVSVLRAVWLVQPVALYAVLVLTYLAWNGQGTDVPSPLVWLLDTTVLTALALVLRLRCVLVVAFALAASMPLSAMLFLGDVPASVVSWGLMHAASFMYVMLLLALRRQMIELTQARALAKTLVAEEEKEFSRSRALDRFARTVHDEVLATFAAAIHFSGEPPLLLRKSAVTALAEMDRDDEGELPPPVELGSDDAARLISDLLCSRAPGVEIRAMSYPGTVSSAAVGAVGLASAEAARNALMHGRGAEVVIKASSGALEVKVTDHGEGFDASSIQAGRMGVRQSIMGRMEQLDGGRWEIDSDAFGTIVMLTWNRCS